MRCIELAISLVTDKLEARLLLVRFIDSDVNRRDTTGCF